MTGLYLLLCLELVVLKSTFAKFMYETIPYQFPMRIGDTFNAKDGGPVIGLYEGSFYEVTSNMKQNVDLRTFDKDESTNDYLLAGGHLTLSLNVKAVGVGVSVSGQYTKNDYDYNSLGEWLGKFDLTHSKQVIQKPLFNVRSDCKDIPKNLLGTHYIRSVSYGRNLDFRAKMSSASNQRSQSIDASIDVSVTVKGITPAVGASIKYQDTDTKTFIKTYISFVADGNIPFLPVSILEAGSFFNEWSASNVNVVYPKQVEIALYDVKAICKSNDIDVNKIPKTWVGPQDEVTLQVFKVIESRIMDFRSTLDRIAQFVQAMDFTKITDYENFLLEYIYSLRWTVVEQEEGLRYYITNNINTENREPDTLKLLKSAEDAYKANLGTYNSWEQYIRMALEPYAAYVSVFCPRGFTFYGDGCYYVSRMAATKPAAEAYCASAASELIEIRYLDEFKFLQEKLSNMTKTDSTIKSKTFMVNAAEEGNYFKWKSGRYVNMKHVEVDVNKKLPFHSYTCLVFKFVQNQWKLFPDFCRFFPDHHFICHRLFF